MAENYSIVFVVDDDDSIRKALERLIQSEGLNVETFSSAVEFLERECFEGPCCLVLDVQMPGLDGLALQEEMQKRDFSMPIIFLTGHGDIPMSVKVMKAGAEDFLTKPFKVQELLDAIHEALEKDRQSKKERSETLDIQQRADRLTRREFDVFSCVIAGLLNKQIGYELGIAERTVKVHRGRVMAKMQADSLAELVRMAERLGISPMIPSDSDNS
jgi:FixJ family two-component response regulator